MPILTKASITIPELPKETVQVPELGGDVIVQSLKLGDRINLSTEGDRKLSAAIPAVLEKCVVGSDGVPLFTAEQWDVWGGAHIDRVLELFRTVEQLSGLGPQEKKEETPSS